VGRYETVGQDSGNKS